jgi:hypothetical protein
MKRPTCVIALGWLASTYYNVGLRSSIFARLCIWDLLIVTSGSMFYEFENGKSFSDDCVAKHNTNFFLL